MIDARLDADLDAELPTSSRSQLHPGGRSGQVLADTYRLLELIGKGGAAEVYSAEHLRLGRRFAVKVLHLVNAPRALARFRREAQAVARVHNDFVVSVIDCGQDEYDTPFLVMELLEGEDLRGLLDRSAPLPIARAVRLLWEASLGVSAVHDAGMVHRDLKPENLYVARRSTGEDWCKVLDFGIAKTAVSAVTVEGALIGTVAYMAPEQLQDSASCGPAADVYALGAILYECLCGVTPHAGATPHELMFKKMNDAPKRLDSVRREVPAALAEVVQRALEMAPERRFRTARELAEAIAPFSRIEPAGMCVRTTASTLMETTTEGSPHVWQAPASRTKRTGQRLGWLALGAALVAAASSHFLLPRSQQAGIPPAMAAAPKPQPQTGEVAASGVTPALPSSVASGVSTAPLPQQRLSKPQKARGLASASIQPRSLSSTDSEELLLDNRN